MVLQAHHKSFWDGLPRPFYCMAPMKDVTDVAFRALIAKRGKPNVFWTEFVSADGLYHTIENKAKRTAGMIYHTSAADLLLRDLQFTEEQRPIVAQIFSSKPEMIAYAAALVAQLGFDGVDINMGCPDKSIEKQCAGAALMKDPALAVELIRAAQSPSSFNLPKVTYRTDLVDNAIPVSVKTRVGYRKDELDTWLPALLSANPAAITLHLRTRKELSLVPADWELMKRAVEIRNRVNPSVLLIGNGDVRDVEEGRRLAEDTGCDGIMIGRAVFGNPWIFESISGRPTSSSDVGRRTSTHGLNEKLDALIELAHDFEKITPPKSFALLKKHIKAFVTGFPGAAELRAKLMLAENASELEAAIRK